MSPDTDPKDNESPDTTGREKVKGVFSSVEVKRLGTGATSRKERIKQYWLVNELDGGQVEVQPINEKLIPIGKKRVVTLDELLERFEPEPEFYVSTSSGITPERWEELRSGKGTGGPPLTVGGFEVSGSSEEVEKNARASFGMGLAYLKRGDPSRAQDVFERLAELKADFRPAHKHMFNDFGIALRKNAMLDTAIKHYRRAEMLARGDENLLHNIARAYYEKRDFSKARQYLEKSLQINPGFRESKLFLKYLDKHHPDSGKPLTVDF